MGLHKRPHLDTVKLAREFLKHHIPKTFGMPLAQFVRAHKKWILDNIMPSYCDASRALKVLCDDAQSLELMERHSEPPRFQDSSHQRSPSRSAPMVQPRRAPHRSSARSRARSAQSDSELAWELQAQEWNTPPRSSHRSQDTQRRQSPRSSVNSRQSRQSRNDAADINASVQINW